jgi:hypothetical protein
MRGNAETDVTFAQLNSAFGFFTDQVVFEQ